MDQPELGNLTAVITPPVVSAPTRLHTYPMSWSNPPPRLRDDPLLSLVDACLVVQCHIEQVW